jgi:hypothetical protein
MFSRSSKTGDGLQKSCKKCVSAYHHEQRVKSAQIMQEALENAPERFSAGFDFDFL